jgi:hypothetical protein
MRAALVLALIDFKRRKTHQLAARVVLGHSDGQGVCHGLKIPDHMPELGAQPGVLGSLINQPSRASDQIGGKAEVEQDQGTGGLAELGTPDRTPQGPGFRAQRPHGRDFTGIGDQPGVAPACFDNQAGALGPRYVNSVREGHSEPAGVQLFELWAFEQMGRGGGGHNWSGTHDPAQGLHRHHEIAGTAAALLGAKAQKPHSRQIRPEVDRCIGSARFISALDQCHERPGKLELLGLGREIVHDRARLRGRG